MSTTSAWGRTRTGHSTVPAALGIGILSALAVATLTALLNDGDMSLAITLGVVTLLPAAMLGWLVVVDSATVAGSTKNPEQSIESSWYERATQGAFHDALWCLGIGLLALSIVPDLRDVSASAVLTALLLVITIDVAVRYRLIACRES